MAISKSLRFDVLRRDHYTCFYCGAKAPNVALEVDHVIPRSRGGSNSMGNLVTACFPCNRGKRAKDAYLYGDYAAENQWDSDQSDLAEYCNSVTDGNPIPESDWPERNTPRQHFSKNADLSTDIPQRRIEWDFSPSMVSAIAECFDTVAL